ncbi:MAG: hypothetical protein WDO74_25940 [Pseudomonadota bacterium]
MPGSPGEVPRYLQRRMTIYLGFASVLWGAAWLLATSVELLTDPEEALGSDHLWRTLSHLTMTLALAGLWWASRRQERSARWLVVADLAGLQCCRGFSSPFWRSGCCR